MIIQVARHVMASDYIGVGRRGVGGGVGGGAGPPII